MTNLGLYGDRVYSSTDLNRRAGEVLDDAREHPVTISRNKEQFALLNRDQAAAWVRANLAFRPLMDLVGGVLSVIEENDPPASLAWLTAFDREDLLKMLREVMSAADAALHETNDWDAVDNIVHEWHQSALAATSGVLEEAMGSPSEEVPLTDPRTVLATETDLGSPRRS